MGAENIFMAVAATASAGGALAALISLFRARIEDGGEGTSIDDLPPALQQQLRQLSETESKAIETQVTADPIPNGEMVRQAIVRSRKPK